MFFLISPFWISEVRRGPGSAPCDVAPAGRPRRGLGRCGRLRGSAPGTGRGKVWKKNRGKWLFKKNWEICFDLKLILQFEDLWKINESLENLWSLIVENFWFFDFYLNCNLSFDLFVENVLKESWCFMFFGASNHQTKCVFWVHRCTHFPPGCCWNDAAVEQKDEAELDQTRYTFNFYVRWDTSIISL